MVYIWKQIIAANPPPIYCTYHSITSHLNPTCQQKKKEKKRKHLCDSFLVDFEQVSLMQCKFKKLGTNFVLF